MQYEEELRFRKVFQGNAFESMSVAFPEKCPYCSVVSVPVNAAALSVATFKGDEYAAVFVCPSCREFFMARYDCLSIYPRAIVPSVPIPRAFSQHIKSLSPQFCSVYNQALASETHGLDELSGMGYRKALEFLIKDYAILCHPDDADSIRAKPLAQCINEMIDYDRLKTLAQRAVWLGNDFTHYERRFDEFEITDLKKFIDAALFWIEAELTTDEAEQITPR